MLNRRTGGAEIGGALGVAAVYLMVFVRMGIPEERTHLAIAERSSSEASASDNVLGDLVNEPAADVPPTRREQ